MVVVTRMWIENFGTLPDYDLFFALITESTPRKVPLSRCRKQPWRARSQRGDLFKYAIYSSCSPKLGLGFCFHSITSLKISE